MSGKKAKALRKQERKKEKIKRKAVFLDRIKGFREILKENWKFLVIILLVTIGIYINGMWGDFVSDDYATVLNNPEIATKWAGGEAASDNPFEIIPITHHLIALMFGVDSPIPYHIASLVVYLLNIVMMFVLIYLLFGRKLASVSTTIFALHPVHVEAVSWISGKPYTYVGLFQMIAYISLIMILYKRSKYWPYLFLSILLSFLSARVHSLAFLFVGPIIVLYLSWKGIGSISKKTLFNFLAILAGSVPFLLLILWPSVRGRVGDVNFGYKGDGGIFYDPFFQYPTSVSKYLQLLWFPADLTLYHTMYVFPPWLNWVILITYLTLLGYTFFKKRDWFFSLAFVFLATAPTMAPVKVSWLTAERYIFLGSVGWCLFLAQVWETYFEKFKLIKWSVLVFVCWLFAIKVFMRNIDWQTNHKLWVATVQVSPNSHNAWNNIGDDYDKLQEYENAIKGFTESTVWKPNYADAFHNRANIYFKLGYFDLARDSYLTALSFNPGLIQTYISLVQVELSGGKLNEALKYAETASQMAPNNFQVRFIKAIVLKELGNIEEARKEAEATVRLNPNFLEARQLYESIK